MCVLGGVRTGFQKKVSDKACVTCGHGDPCQGRAEQSDGRLLKPLQTSAQPVRVCAAVCAGLSVRRGFLESADELIAEGLVTAHQSIIAFAVSSRREECGDAISDEPHLIFCPLSSKKAWRSFMVRTLLFNSHLEDVCRCF